MKRFLFVTTLMTLALASCESNKQQAPEPASAPAPTAAPQVSPSPAAAAETNKLSCTKGGDTRILEIVKNGPGCITNYTKNGKTTVAAKSKHGDKHCVDYQNKVRDKLVHSGYKCQ